MEPMIVNNNVHNYPHHMEQFIYLVKMVKNANILFGHGVVDNQGLKS